MTSCSGANFLLIFLNLAPIYRDLPFNVPYIYRRTGFKCVVKCLRLRENKLIAFPIIAVAARIRCTWYRVVIIFCVPMIANPGKIRNSQLLAARKHFPSYGIAYNYYFIQDFIWGGGDQDTPLIRTPLTL